MRETFKFASLRELFAKANEEKSGDQLAGIAAQSEQERVAAKHRFSEIPNPRRAIYSLMAKRKERVREPYSCD